jgi:hypothetical protein
MNDPKPDNGGQAFPVPAANALSDGSCYLSGVGMTLRDYFAAAALNGMIASTTGPDLEYIARLAYDLADALIAVRKMPVSDAKSNVDPKLDPNVDPAGAVGVEEPRK